MSETLLSLYRTLPQAQRLELLEYASYLSQKQHLQVSMPVRKSGYGALKDKIRFVADDFDDALEDMAEYMQ